MNIPLLLPMVGWSLASPAMLAWGAAAPAPLLIHLLSRRRYRPEPWAAMTFLLAAMHKHARRIRVQQWILLALRTAILVLFVLAIAEPRRSADSAFSAGTKAGWNHWLLVVDDSYSMSWLDGEQTLLEAAKKAAAARVDQGRPQDAYTLVLMAEPSGAIIDQPSFDRRAVQQQIANLKPSHARAELTQTLSLAQTMLDRAKAGQHQPAEQRVIFFTDLQKTTWGEANLDNCRSRLEYLAQVASLELVDVGRKDAANRALVRLEMNSAFSGLPVVGQNLRIEAHVQSFDSLDRPAEAVEILVDGQPIAIERIHVEPHGRATVGVPYRFISTGEHLIEARLPKDALPLDDRRLLSVQVADALRVLCLGGKPGATRRLALALAPREGAGQPIEVSEALESRLLDNDLDSFDCVFLYNIGRFSKEEAAILRRYVLQGGAAVFLLGDQVEPRQYNELLANGDSPPLLPARLLGVSAAGDYRFDPLDYRDEIVAPFRGFERGGLLSTPIWKYVRLAPREGSRVALALNTGDAAIVESAVGRGRSVMVATSEATDDASWTALELWPSFPPLVHEIVRFAVGSRDQDHNRMVGDSLSGFVRSSDPMITLTTPNGSQERIAAQEESGASAWRFGPVTRTGVYEARYGDRIERFAVNVDTRESDLVRVERAHLPGMFQRESKQQQSLSGNPQVAGATDFRWLVAAVLALMLLEPCLAWQFSRRRG